MQGSNAMRIAVALAVLAVRGLSAAALQEASSGAREAPRTQSADRVILNARLWRGPGDAQPGMGAKGESREGAAHDETKGYVAIQGDRILAVGEGSNALDYIGAMTQVFDAEGRRVIPGITDSHTHIIGGGLQLAALNLRDAPDKEAFISAVEKEVRSRHPGEWITGGRWSVESWRHREEPTKEWLDPVTEDVPVLLKRMDGHQALANSAALKIAGITRGGPADPVGGEIQRDPKTGEPTGILKESAMDLVERRVPPESPEQLYEALIRSMRELNTLGITSVHDMADPSHLEVFQRALRAGDLTLRLNVYVMTDDWDGWMDRVAAMGRDGAWLRVLGFKGYMDGSLGSRTAYMREKYSDLGPDAKYPRGQLTDFADPPEELNRKISAADARGLQLAVHAIGDEANHLLLDAIECAQQRNGARDGRHRSEHAQHLLVGDIPRFAQLDVVASMQPFHKADDGRYAESRLGVERLEGSYAFRALVDAGVIVAFGSDWPVVTANPFAGMEAAVHAKTLEGRIWLESHSLTIEEALTAYTLSPARAVHREGELGTLAPGKYADLVVLEDDPLDPTRKRLDEVRVYATLVGGRVVFQRN